MKWVPSLISYSVLSINLFIPLIEPRWNTFWIYENQISERNQIEKQETEKTVQSDPKYRSQIPIFRFIVHSHMNNARMEENRNENNLQSVQCDMRLTEIWIPNKVDNRQSLIPKQTKQLQLQTKQNQTFSKSPSLATLYKLRDPPRTCRPFLSMTVETEDCWINGWTQVWTQENKNTLSYRY